MENPSRKMLSAAGFVVIGILIGLVPGQIKIDQMKSDAEFLAAANARDLAQLRADMHTQEVYYIKELHLYRQAAGIRDVLPSPTDVADGMTCNQEFGIPGQAGSGRRSWKPRSDARCYDEDAR